MFKNNFFLNPKRTKERGFRSFIKKLITLPVVNFLNYCGFLNINYSFVHGSKSRLSLGENCSTMNTFFNLISGTIRVGSNTIFGHNCMVLTGTHNFFNGKRGSLNLPQIKETPLDGRDILIGEGCFIGSGAILIGPLIIGDNVIIAAGSVVNKNIPNACFVAGVPAEVKKKF
mgnify:CR=1 FL=1